MVADSKGMRVGSGTPLVMLLCRVLLGSPFVCRSPKDFIRPPCKTCGDDKCKEHSEFHDSVIGLNRTSSQALLFREFVVYDRAQCYPEYLIHYIRN